MTDQLHHRVAGLWVPSPEGTDGDALAAREATSSGRQDQQPLDHAGGGLDAGQCDQVRAHRRCCADRERVRPLPFLGESRFDRVPLRLAQRCHAVEQVAGKPGFNGLGINTAGSHSITDYSLVHEERILGAALPMVASLLLPLATTDRS